MIEKLCGVCGSNFKVHACNLKRGQGQYCSYQCSGIAKKGANNHQSVDKAGRDCKWCKERFLFRPKELKYGGKVYCSKSCQKSHQAEIKLNKQIYCKQCGNLITGHGKFFCSNECNGRWKLIHHLSTKVEKHCKVCDKVYFVSPAINSYGQGIYCSQSCMGYDRSANATKQLYRGKAGYRDDFPDLYFRSSWEANWARYLSLLQEQGSIKSWLFEPDTFRINFLGRITSYTPDFKVSFLDGRIEYQEVKGLLSNYSRDKMTLMPILFPDVKIVMVFKDTYESVRDNYSLLIPTWEFKTKERTPYCLYTDCLKCGKKTRSKHLICIKCQ